MNYKVVISFDREQIITQDQKDKLMLVLMDSPPTFIVINEIIIQTKDIRIIEPTYERTDEEIKLKKTLRERIMIHPETRIPDSERSNKMQEPKDILNIINYRNGR